MRSLIFEMFDYCETISANKGYRVAKQEINHADMASFGVSVY